MGTPPIHDKSSYNRLPVDVDQQLNILQSRGMFISDYASAKKFLEQTYFHRFVSYAVPFLIKGDRRNYQPHTKFADVVAIYHFDSKLRLLILDAIERIEISLRAQFIGLSWKYGPHFYMEHKFFSDHKLLNESIERVEYQLKSSNDLFVNEYYEHYVAPNLPPIWVAMEVITIGQLNKWIANLKNYDDRQTIASHYKIPHNALQIILDNLTIVRNFAAHHTRIWNRHFNFTGLENSSHALINHAFCSDGKIYSLLLSVGFLLKNIYGLNEYISNLEQLISKYRIDTKLMGFPENWQQLFNELSRAK